MIVIVAIIAGAIGGGSVVYINDTVKQAMSLSQPNELRIPQRTQTPNVPETSPIQENNNGQGGVPVPDGTGVQQ